jgi:diguanylate cyclase (GGDEF)-like protein
VSRFSLNMPIHFWAADERSATCSFPIRSSMTRFASWAAIIAAGAFELLAAYSPGAIRLALVFFAVLAPLAALLFFHLDRRYRLLNIAIANMWQGLAFYDADGQLVLYNGQFCAMLGLRPADVRRARMYRDIIDLSVQAGNHDGRSAEEVWRQDAAFIARRQSALAYIDLPNNRTIAESHEPTADGGWVRTYADVTGRRQVEARIVHMARHDSLTDLPNRVFFHEKLEHALESASDRAPIALMFLDLDGFKAVNDTWGHAAGDRLLELVAQRLRCAVRDIDTVARLGGDEFAIIQIGVEDASQARELAKRLIAAIGDPFDIDGASIGVSASLGITFAPTNGIGIDELLRNADVALYRAKSSGRGTYCFFAAEMETHVNRRRIPETELRQAAS